MSNNSLDFKLCSLLEIPDFEFGYYESLSDVKDNIRIVRSKNSNHPEDFFLLERRGYNIYYYPFRLKNNKTDKLDPLNKMQEWISFSEAYHNSLVDYNNNPLSYYKDEKEYGEEFWGSHKQCQYVSYGYDISNMLFRPDLVESDLNSEFLANIYFDLVEKPFIDLFKLRSEQEEVCSEEIVFPSLDID